MTVLDNLLKPERIPLGAKVTRNVVYAATRFIILAPLPFLLIPYFLKKLGTAGYGTWAVFLAVNGMTSLADFGLVTSVSKHVAQYHAVKDFRALAQLISTGMLLYSGIAVAMGGFLWASSRVLVPALFRNGTLTAPELMSLWKYLILLVSANILTLLFSSVVVGLQRMDLTTGLDSMNLILSAGLSVSLLHEGMGLRGMLYGYVVAACIVAILYGYIVRRLLPEVRPNVASCSWKVAREILTFSSKAYVTQIAVAIHNQIEKFYLARFVGVIPVGWYDISSGLALKLRGIPGLVLTPIMPAASELEARNDHARMLSLYFRAHKYLAFIGIPLIVYTVLVSRHLVELWVGPSLGVIAIPLSILLITNFINLTTGPGFLILMGRGKLRPGLYSAVLGIFLNLTLSYGFIRGYGFQGAVTGTSVSLTVAAGFFLFQFQRETKSSLLKLAKIAYLKPILSSSVIGGIGFFFLRAFAASWFGLFTGAVIFGIAYLFLLLMFKFFDSSDLAIVENVMEIPAFIRRAVPRAELNHGLHYGREFTQPVSE